MESESHPHAVPEYGDGPVISVVPSAALARKPSVVSGSSNARPALLLAAGDMRPFATGSRNNSDVGSTTSSLMSQGRAVPRSIMEVKRRKKAHNKQSTEAVVRELVNRRLSHRPGALAEQQSEEADRRRPLGMASTLSGDAEEYHFAGGAALVAVHEEEKLPASVRFRATVADLKTRAAPQCRVINKNRFFQGSMLLALVGALFLPDIWVLASRPTNHDLDVLLTIVLFMFLLEMCVQCIGLWRSYVASFYFWMDILGLGSMMLDLSYIPIMSNLGESTASNVVLLRAARVAKLGARAGRFTKLVKLLRFLPGLRDAGSDANTAKQISGRLMNALSMRVSCLIILMVMIMPLFNMWTFPVQDSSMESWLQRLDAVALGQPEELARQIARCRSFYSGMSYRPFSISAKEQNALPAEALELLPWRDSGSAPARATDIYVVSSGNLLGEFNFAPPHQMDSLMNCLLMVVIIVLMVGFSLVLSNAVSAIVLKPLDKLLLQVHTMASTIFKSVADITTDLGKEEKESEAADAAEQNGTDPMNAFGNETALLDRVVQKLAVLQQSVAGKEEMMAGEGMDGLGESDLAMISGFYGDARKASFARGVTMSESEEQEDEAYAGLLSSQRTMVENAGLSMDLLNSWVLNPLELDKPRNHAAAMYFLGPHNHGMPFDPVEMAHFLEAAELGYQRILPYHNWYHAVDVTHCIYRLLHICCAESYLSRAERFALLISAVCHDLGHPGLNNAFLIEASHELALRYNDRSPLENMHCAKLYELVSTPSCNIFGQLPPRQFQEVRKSCIDAILYTDNALHFSMIKDVQMLYEMNSDVLDAQMHADDQLTFPMREAIQVFRQVESRCLFVKVLLHTADISNSVKPFRICRIWAWQVLEEFFAQGDMEKRLGVPVQALNDREKVNRPMSQFGFIEFLVSPLFFAVVKVLPPTLPHVEQMMQNVRTWHQNWLAEASPPPSEAEKSALEERFLKLQGKHEDLFA